MSKELPYFKFEPAEYLTKDVSFCSLAAQGLFMNLCAFYWQRNCQLTKSQFLKRMDHDTEFNELLEEGIFDLEGDRIVIKFLDVQMLEASETSRKNSVNGKKGGRPKNPNKTQIKPTALVSQSQTKGIREEEIREEENKQKKGGFSDSEILEIDVDYDEVEFVSDWNELRTEHLKKPSYLKRIGSQEDVRNFKDLLKSYVRLDFRHGMIGLFKQRVLPNGNTTMQSNPSHFLKFFNSYLTAYHDKNHALYGREKQNAI